VNKNIWRFMYAVYTFLNRPTSLILGRESVTIYKSLGY